MRSLNEIEQANGSIEKSYWLYCYFGVVFVGIVVGSFKNPDATSIYDLTDPVRYLSELSFGLLGLALLYIAIFRRDILGLVNDCKLGRKIAVTFLVGWGLLAIYSSSLVVVGVVKLKIASGKGIAIVQGIPSKYMVLNRKISFYLNGVAYSIECSYGCNFPYSSKVPQEIRVYVIHETNDIFKIEKIR